MQDRMTEDKPTRVPARANRWWNQPSAIGLGGTEGLTGVLGDRAKSVLLLGRAPTDWKAGCGRSARQAWEGGGAFLLVSPLLGPLPARASRGEDEELDAALTSLTAWVFRLIGGCFPDV